MVPTMRDSGTPAKASPQVLVRLWFAQPAHGLIVQGILEPFLRIEAKDFADRDPSSYREAATALGVEGQHRAA